MSQLQSYSVGITLAVFTIILCVMALKSRNKASDLQTYALGSLSFSPALVALSLAASLTSAATFIINPGFIALYGLSGYLAFGVVMPLSIFIALVVLMKRFRKYGVVVQSISIADWLGKRYDSRFLKLFFGALSVLLITFIVLICVGITKVISKALGADELNVLIGVVVIVFAYILMGGANAMVYTNTIQAGVMIIVAAILLGSDFLRVLDTSGAGLFAELAAIDPALLKPFNETSPLFRDFFEVVVCNAIVGIAIVCQPHILTKSLLIRNERQMNRFLFYAIAVLVLFFSVVFAGFYARAYFPDLTAGGVPLQMDGIISAYVVSRFPVYITLLLILGLIAAGLSTLEGLVQALPTTLTNDLILPLMGKDQSYKGSMKINRFVGVLIGLVAIVLSWNQLKHPNLSVAIFAQNGVYAFFSAAFVPVFFGIFTRVQDRRLPIVASVTALLVHFAVYYLELTPYMKDVQPKNPAVASAIALMVSVMVGLIWYLITKKERAGKVNSALSEVNS